MNNIGIVTVRLNFIYLFNESASVRQKQKKEIFKRSISRTKTTQLACVLCACDERLSCVIIYPFSLHSVHLVFTEQYAIHLCCCFLPPVRYIIHQWKHTPTTLLTTAHLTQTFDRNQSRDEYVVRMELKKKASFEINYK